MYDTFIDFSYLMLLVSNYRVKIINTERLNLFEIDIYNKTET